MNTKTIFCLLLFAVILCTCGCERKIEYIPIEYLEPRQVCIETEPFLLPGVAPFTMSFHYDVGTESQPDGTVIPIRRAAVDFGEGYGFTEITQKLQKIGDTRYFLDSTYTYSKPGTYTLRAFVEYGDGEIGNYTFPVPIEVLPMDEGEGE